MRDWLFRHGLAANIFFRNMVLLVAAYCHYRAALIVLQNRDWREANHVLFGALLLGFLYL